MAGGLDADTYNWQDLSGANVGGTVNGQDWTTLNFLRGARDHNASPLFTANIRGIGAGIWSSFAYTDTSASTLATVASQWVRYTNYILQNYRQGDTLSASDAAIMSNVSWGAGDDTLLARGEAVTPKVAYWEVGNEPENHPREFTTTSLPRTMCLATRRSARRWSAKTRRSRWGRVAAAPTPSWPPYWRTRPRK